MVQAQARRDSDLLTRQDHQVLGYPKVPGAYNFPTDGGVSFRDTEQLDTPIFTIPTTYPVWRARYLPFGIGVLSLPHRGKAKLEMWRPDRPEAPMQSFEVEGNSVVKEYVWRTKGGNDAAFGRLYQPAFFCLFPNILDRRSQLSVDHMVARLSTPVLGYSRRRLKGILNLAQAILAANSLC